MTSPPYYGQYLSFSGGWQGDKRKEILLLARPPGHPPEGVSVFAGGRGCGPRAVNPCEREGRYEEASRTGTGPDFDDSFWITRVGGWGSSRSQSTTSNVVQHLPSPAYAGRDNAAEFHLGHEHHHQWQFV